MLKLGRYQPQKIQSSYLKGPCHKDIAVLCQFCAEVIFHNLLPNAPVVINKVSSHITNSTHNNFWWIFEGIALLKLEKIGPTFSSVNPCPSLPSVATDGRSANSSSAYILACVAGPLKLTYGCSENSGRTPVTTCKCLIRRLPQQSLRLDSPKGDVTGLP